MLQEYTVYNDDGLQLATVLATDEDDALRVYRLEDVRSAHYVATNAKLAA